MMAQGGPVGGVAGDNFPVGGASCSYSFRRYGTSDGPRGGLPLFATYGVVEVAALWGTCSHDRAVV